MGIETNGLATKEIVIKKVTSIYKTTNSSNLQNVLMIDHF